MTDRLLDVLLAALQAEAKTWEFAVLEQERIGHCYKLAYHFVQDHPEWDLVHGIIRWTIAGRTIGGHAWVEREGQVWEPYTEVTVSREIWYQGVLLQDEDYRYSSAEAALLGRRTGMYDWTREERRTFLGVHDPDLRPRA